MMTGEFGWCLCCKEADEEDVPATGPDGLCDFCREEPECDAGRFVPAAAGRGAADGASRPDTVRFTIDGRPHQLPGDQAATSADALLRMTGLSADTHDLARVPGPREVITRLDQVTVGDGDQFISIRISTGTA
jgi:hypothetical protein